MPLHILGLLASLAVALSEMLVGITTTTTTPPLDVWLPWLNRLHACCCCSNILSNNLNDVTSSTTNNNARLSGVCFVTAIVLLLCAGHVSYFIFAVLIAVLGVAMVALTRCQETSSSYRGSGSNSRSSRFMIAAPLCLLLRILAALLHLVACWILPFAVCWGWSSAYDDPVFFGQEIGHLVPSTFYYVGLVLLPLLLMPPGYETGDLSHQHYEGCFLFGSSIIYFLIFRTVHYVQHQTMNAPNWDHELLGLIWGFSGAIGAVMAWQGKHTSVHVGFPALWVCFSMLTHSMSDTQHDEMGMSAPEQMTWMKLHMLHGMCFGLAALCRLLVKLPEAVFFFFLGAIFFCFSAQWMVKYLVQVFDNAGIENFPVDHIVALVVATIGVVVFPLHLLALGQLRQPLDQMASAGFMSLPTTEAPPVDEEEDLDDTTEESYETEQMIIAKKESSSA